MADEEDRAPVIATTAARARPGHLFLAAGRTQLVTDALGLVTGTANEGLFVDNTRVLSYEELLLDGQPLLPFVAALVGRRSLLAYAQAAPTDAVPPRSVYAEVHRRLAHGMHVDIRFHNYGASPARPELQVRLAADFADTEETHRGERTQAAAVTADWDASTRRLTFTYGHPDLRRATAVTVDAGPRSVRYEDELLRVELDLPPKEVVEVRLRVEPLLDGTAGPAAVGEVGDVAAVQDRLLADAPRLTTTNTTVAQAWATAVADLASLPLGLPTGPAAPGAGLPLYQYLFGRDSLTIGWQALLAMPGMARDALAVNAARRGRVVDDWRDEEPGKLIHQARAGPVSELGENPFSAYFGDYAAPQDFLILLGQHLAWTDDVQATRALLAAARDVIDWLRRFGDVDSNGFLEYVRRSPRGVKNQGWKDSPDAIVDDQGHVVKDPIATCEVQAYWYIGLRQAALAFLRAGDRAYAAELLREAASLRRRFHKAFWMPEASYYALALDADGRQVRSITSNPGHLLATGIVPASKASSVIDRLLAPDLFTGWGIRTLSSHHPSYNPFSYHLGSVWPVDSATFALGFVRYGRVDALHRLAEAFFAAADLFAAARLPESLGGLARDATRAHPGIYPEANEPQGWSASAVVLMVQALLGLRPVAPARLLFVDPRLPPWLPDLRLEGIRVGRATVDLDARRVGDATEVTWEVKGGPLRVLRQPPPQAPITNPVRRLVARAERTFE